MDKQDTFDIVAEHLLKQGKRAVDSGLCLYRAPEGRKCAFGVLIPDELYDPILENTSVSQIFGCVASTRTSDQTKYDAVSGKIREHFGTPSIEEVELLRRLQQVHDTYDPETWDLELARLAGKYDLETDVIFQNRRR